MDIRAKKYKYGIFKPHLSYIRTLDAWRVDCPEWMNNRVDPIYKDVGSACKDFVLINGSIRNQEKIIKFHGKPAWALWQKMWVNK